MYGRSPYIYCAHRNKHTYICTPLTRVFRMEPICPMKLFRFTALMRSLHFIHKFPSIEVSQWAFVSAAIWYLFERWKQKLIYFFFMFLHHVLFIFSIFLAIATLLSSAYFSCWPLKLVSNINSIQIRVCMYIHVVV